MKEYFDKGHAEPVSVSDLERPQHKVLYLPMHAVRKDRTTTYVDDGLTGADSVEEAVELQRQLQYLFSQIGFLLRKWNSSEPAVLQHITLDIRDSKPMHTLPDAEEYTKILGIEWNSSENAYTGVIYLRMTNSEGNVHISLGTAIKKSLPNQVLNHPSSETLWCLLACSTPPPCQRSISSPTL